MYLWDVARPLHEIYLVVSTRPHPDAETRERLCLRDSAWILEVLRVWAAELDAHRITTIPAALRWLAQRGAYQPSPDRP